MKSKFSFTIWAALAAVFLPLAALSQVAPETGNAPADRTEAPTKYAVFLGGGYVSLNQVPQSRYGLFGETVSVTRDWGKYFGVTVDGGSYSHSTTSGNPGTPSVGMVLAGPEFHAHIYERTSVLAHVLLGGEHTGGESATPNISFAGGVGAGLEYRVKGRFSVRAYGDDIASSFAVGPAGEGFSPHMRRNARASFGVVYSF